MLPNVVAVAYFYREFHTHTMAEIERFCPQIMIFLSILLEIKVHTLNFLFYVLVLLYVLFYIFFMIETIIGNLLS